MDQSASVIVAGAERMMGLSEALLKGVDAERFARFTAPGGQPVNANHPAFIYGHLALYPAYVLTAAGEDAAAAATPASFGDLFSKGVDCVDDPEGTIYPAMDEVVGVFNTTHRAVIERVKSWPDSKMAEKHTIEGPMSEAFPTVGHVAGFMLLAHTMMHLGQMSTWRRCEGLGSAM